MSEYIKRHAGGFYIVDEHSVSGLVTVRRAVHQLIDPKTDHPFPEVTPEEQYVRSLEESRDLWRQQYECRWSNALPENTDLTEDSLEHIIERLRAWP